MNTTADGLLQSHPVAPQTVAGAENERLTSLRADASRSRESAATSTGDFRRQLLDLASDIDVHVANLETAWRKKSERE